MTLLTGESLVIFVAATISLALSSAATSLRLFVRIKMLKNAFGWDDALITVATVCNIVFNAVGMAGCTYGIGQKMWDIPAENRSTAMMLWWLGALFYAPAAVAARISLALSLLRLTQKRVHLIILRTLIGWTTIDGTVSWFMILLQCHPVSYFWTRVFRKGSGSCLSIEWLVYVNYIYSVSAFLVDGIIAVLPATIVWKLQISTTSKLYTAGLLGMGCLATVAVAVRIPYIHDYTNPDFLYATSPISFWSNIETGLGITAAGLMTLRPLLRYFQGHRHTQRSHQVSYPQPAGGTNSLRSPQKAAFYELRDEISL